MTSLSLCQFVLRIEFQVKNHFSSELKGITLVVSTFQGSMPHFLPVYSPLVFFLQVLIVQSVQLLSGVRLFVTPWTAARQSSLFITNSETLLKLMSIESVMPPNHFILCHPLLINLSQHQSLFQWVSSSHQVAQVLEFQLQHQSFQWIFRTDFF